MNIKAETKKFKQGYTYVIGTDEVGRGCLAGPVVAAAVVFDKGLKIKDLSLKLQAVDDSKLLTPLQREFLSAEIKKTAVAWSVGVVSPNVIDARNIHHASLRAMHIAVSSVLAKRSSPDNVFLFVDGKFQVPNLSIEQEAVIDGDSKIFSVACASIIAKVYRDNLMRKLHVKHPEYGFQNHKGYATVEHRNAIIKFGLLEYHRKTFCSKYLQMI